jgi:3'-5' exoribonuclease
VTATVRAQVRSLETRQGKNGPYDVVKLGDATRSLEAKDFRRSITAAGEPEFVTATVKVEAYQGRPSAIVEKAIALEGADPDDFSEFDRATNELHRTELDNLIASMGDSPYKALVAACLQGKVLEAYCNWTAAKVNHHAYQGGLLEHSLEVTQIALALCEMGDAAFDRDLLIAGCLLHDIGKLDEYQAPPALEWGLGATFIGHVAAGQIRLGMAVQRAADAGYAIPAAAVYRLAHMIEMHHGGARLDTGREFVGPEVRALCAADDFSSHLRPREREQTQLLAAEQATDSFLA